MKYQIHKNNWTIIFDKSNDIRNFSQSNINDVAKLIAKHTVVVFKQQFLTIEEEIEVIKKFKNPRQFFPNTNEIDVGYKNCVIKNSDHILVRVTGEKDEDGNVGFTGNSPELDWHCNDPVRSDRHPIVWLYGAKGTTGSRTTWNNNILSYIDLDLEYKEKVKDLKIVVRHLWNEEANTSYTPSVLHKNIANQTGLYFPFKQIKKFVDKSPEESQTIIKYLGEFTTQEKYCYHHDWQDGDIVLSEQWLGIHKRWPCYSMQTRILHRAVMDFPDQEYS